MTNGPLKRTPLHDAHRALNARLVDFGGWDMPLHYGSQIEEHHRVRRDAGIFDVSHMLVLDVRGANVHDFLRGLLANDVARLRAPGKALYSCMLNEAGGVLDDLIVYRLAADRYRLVVNAATANKDLTWITQQRDAATHAPTIEVKPRRDLAIIAVQGPNARELVWQARPTMRAATASLPVFHGIELADEGGAPGAFVARTGYTGEDGFEVILEAEHAPALWHDLLAVGAGPCGLGARDTLRLEAGMNLYGQDMDESVSPLESGLAWTVDLTSERPFIGREALLARPPRTQLVGLVLLGKGVLRSHQAVRAAPGPGVITSGSFSPTLNGSIALARVPLEVAIGDAVEVQIREKWVAAKAVKYPFVRRGTPLVSLSPG